MTTATTLGPRMRQTLDYLREHPYAEIDEIRYHAYPDRIMPPRQVRVILHRLEHLDLIRRAYPYCTPRWYAV